MTIVFRLVSSLIALVAFLLMGFFAFAGLPLYTVDALIIALVAVILRAYARF